MATSLELTSTGELLCSVTREDADLPLDVSERIWQAFEAGTARGLLHLATTEIGTALPPTLAWWREFVCQFLSQLRRSPLVSTHSEDKRRLKNMILRTKRFYQMMAVSKFYTTTEKPGVTTIESDAAWEEAPKYWHKPEESAWEAVTKHLNVLTPSKKVLAFLLQRPPKMAGSQFLSVERLQEIWEKLSELVWDECGWRTRVWLQKQNPLWQKVGQLVLQLSENLEDEEHPFFFKVDYAAQLTGRGNLMFMGDPQFKEIFSHEENNFWVMNSLKSALADLVGKLESGAKKPDSLRSCSDIVLNCIQGTNLENEIRLGRSGAKGSYHLGRVHRWTAEQAFRFLLDVSRLEGKGFDVLVPEWWVARQSRRLRALVIVGDQKTQKLGINALLDISVKLTTGDEELSQEELMEVLTSSAGLVRVKEKWMEVDQKRLQGLLDRWETLRQFSIGGGTRRSKTRLRIGLTA